MNPGPLGSALAQASWGSHPIPASDAPAPLLSWSLYLPTELNDGLWAQNQA